MKIALDTDALIKVTSSDKLTSLFVKKVQASDIGVSVHKRALEEFWRKPTKSQIERVKEIESLWKEDNRQWFTIGVSTIGGPDTIPAGSYSPFNQDFSERKYQQHKKDSPNPKSREEWVRKKQGDPTIYSWAVENSCDFLLTDNTKDYKKVAKNYRTDLMTINQFLQI